jgi:hypothetical protein
MNHGNDFPQSSGQMLFGLSHIHGRRPWTQQEAAETSSPFLIQCIMIIKDRPRLSKSRWENNSINFWSYWLNIYENLNRSVLDSPIYFSH